MQIFQTGEESMALQKLSSYVQRKGQVTIPQELRDLFNIKPGDQIYFKQSEEGILITTESLERLAQFEEALAELSELMAQKQAEEGKMSSIEELIEEIRDQRSQTLKEKYGLDSDDDQRVPQSV
jgi:AbrB family looped-hinge helix DNA binding protein